MLIASRAVQGLGAAIISPAALSIIMTTFEEGAERNKALGIWGAMGGSGAAVGVLAGGVLTKYLGWEWIFFVNVPVGVIAFVALAAARPREPRRARRARPTSPAPSTVTAGIALLVYAVSNAPNHGWGSAWTLGRLALTVVLLVAFLVIESRVTRPVDAVLDLPDPHGDRRERLGRAARRGHVLELLRAHPVRAAGAALLGAEDRA